MRDNSGRLYRICSAQGEEKPKGLYTHRSYMRVSGSGLEMFSTWENRKQKNIEPEVFTLGLYSPQAPKQGSYKIT